MAGDEEARRDVIDYILARLPLRNDEGATDLRVLLEDVTGNATAFGIVGIFGLMFAASGLISAVRNGVNAAWEAEDRRPPVQGKLLDILLVLGVGLVIGLSLGLTLALRFVSEVGIPVGEVVPVLISFVVFLFIFLVLPARDTHLRDVWPGALVAAVGYEAAKLGFSLYLSGFANYGAVYGSIGAVIAFLVFVFVAANLFLFGAEVASEWPRVRDAPRESFEGGPPAREQLKSALRGLVRR